MRRASRVPSLLLGSVILLLALSVLMVYSTTALSSSQTLGSPFAILKKHVIQITLGLIALFVASKIKPERLYHLAPFFLIFAIGSLVIVLIPGIGHSAGGARRWFSLGPLRLQPGELVKVAVVLYISSYISRRSDRMLKLVPGTLLPLGVVSGLGLLLLMQPDFGTTVVIFLVVFIQLFFVSRLTHIFGLALIALLAVAGLIIAAPYRMRRFESFLDPLQDASASGYQLVQSLIAVGSGGIFGEGLGSGQQKLFYLPAAHTDFIFAVIAEELGLFGAIAVLALFITIAWCGLATARKHVASPYLSSFALGLTSLLVVPALLNMAVVLGLLPTKGLVLPLVAYGGTAMFVNCTIVGLLLRLARMSPGTSEELK